MRIEDFDKSLYSTIVKYADILEIAKIMQPSMKGNVFIPVNKIAFKPLKINSFEMGTLERLRDYSSPKLKDTKIGKCLIWDVYAIRLKELK